MKTIELLRFKSWNPYSFQSRFIYTVMITLIFLFSITMPVAARGEGEHHERGGRMHEGKGERKEMKLERRENRMMKERPYNRPNITPEGRMPGNVYSSNNVTINNRIVSVNRPEHNWPARGAAIDALPSGSIVRVHAGIRFAFNNGIFYRPYSGHYVVCAPPVGFRIRFLPMGFITFSLMNIPYYYYAGAYYQRVGPEYVVVEPPLGALVQSIPQGGQQLIIDGNTYYIVDGVQYQAVIYNDQIWYKVIKVDAN
ncbi:DUF6515 family protein [Microbacter margulisiae]|uniref:Uncharacterized protein n=1 Tax=Microbacter margulisiae TaxID=1350067 RepID=A0A7W5DRJ4_9PORP|nr:DUF6515 family protein [Microbacter margulisiae]MBB3187767.1 hypothetical protein [Microbacter margulisiae]